MPQLSNRKNAEHTMISDNYEMRECHRQLLKKNRMYLLHNLRPTETFWSSLQEKGILSEDMRDEIRGCVSLASQIGKLLDLLPARGPMAFDNFCEALLEADHSYVAEYLKTHEVTDTFRLEVEPLTSDLMLEQLVSIFKKNTPTVQRFAERKFELILEEQERDLDQKDLENRDLSSRINVLTLEVAQLKNFLSSCTEISEHVKHEIERDFVSKMFLREEKKHLDNLRQSLLEIEGFEKMCSFYANMKTLLVFLDKYAGLQNRDEEHMEGMRAGSASKRGPSAHARNLQCKMTAMTNMLVALVDDFGTRTNIAGQELRTELEKVLRFTQGIMGDVSGIREVFKSTVKQKKQLESEVLSLLHDMDEIRRLDREVTEKQAHVDDLNKQAQVLKRKTKHHRKQLDQIQSNADQRKTQMRELRESRQQQMNDADMRLQRMLTLLPDLDDPDYARGDTDLTSEASSAGNTPDRVNTPGKAVTSLHDQVLRNLAAQKEKTSETEEREEKPVLLERRKAKQGMLKPRKTKPTEERVGIDANEEGRKAKNDDLRKKLKRLVPTSEAEKVSARLEYKSESARHDYSSANNFNKESSREVTRECVCANITSLDAADMARHYTKGFDLDNWVPPKHRYAERESIRTNRVEITLSSKLDGDG